MNKINYIMKRNGDDAKFEEVQIVPCFALVTIMLTGINANTESRQGAKESEEHKIEEYFLNKR